MQLKTKKLLTIVTEAILEADLTEQCDRLGIRGYTIYDVRGRGKRGFRRAEWEQTRTIRIQIVDDWQRLEALIQWMKHEFEEQYAMFMFVTDVEVIDYMW